MKDRIPNVVFIFGPTATGKSDLGIKIAKIFNGEIISADSMQVFKGLDIGTAKLTPDKWQGINHHLIDVVNANSYFSAADYFKLALEAIDIISSKNKLPIVVGGTGLYFKVLLKGIFPAPKKDDTLRLKLAEERALIGVKAFWEKFYAIDPEAANRIAMTDERRIIRALEVYYLTDKPISQHFKEDLYVPSFNPIIIGLNLERSILYKKIEERCDKMLSSGLIEEVKNMIDNGFTLDNVSMQAIGYKQIYEYLNNKYDYEEMERLFKRDSRHLAKRQVTLFKQIDGVVWFDYNNFDSIIEHIKTKLN